MPGFGSMKQMDFDAAGGGSPYWGDIYGLPAFNGNGSVFSTTSMAIDNNGYVYTAGGAILGNTFATPHPGVVAINTAGQLIWANTTTLANTVTSTSYNSSFQTVASNSTNGNTYAGGGSTMITFNNASNSSWYKMYQISGGNIIDSISDLQVMNSGNVTLGGGATIIGSNRPILSVLSAAGDSYWTKNLPTTSLGTPTQTGTYFWQNIVVDKPGTGTNNIYASISGGFQWTAVSTYYYNGSIIAKYNSNGALQWSRARTYGPSATGGDCQGLVAVDSSSNVYFAWGYMNQSGTVSPNIVLTKWNSGGTQQWETALNLTNSDLYATKALAINTDSSGNIYILCTSVGNTIYTSNTYLLKYNSSGTLQWQREIAPYLGTTTGVGVWGTDMRITPTNTISVALYLTSGPGAAAFALGTAVLNLPNDGSKTGYLNIPITGSYYSPLTANIAYSSTSFTTGTVDSNIHNESTFTSYSVVGSTSTLVTNTTTINSFTSNSLAQFGGPLTTNTTYF